MRARTLLWSAGALAAAGTVLLVLVLLGWPPLWNADRELTYRLHETAVSRPGWTRANRLLTDWIWDPVTLRLLAALAVLGLVRRRAWRTAGWLATATLTAFAVQNGLKALTARERPQWPDPVDSARLYAFPSGHAMTATVVCGVLLVVVLRHAPAAGLPGGRRLRAAVAAVAVCSVLGVGVTRVYLGVHWPSDVLAGWLFGGAVTAASAVPFLRRRPGSGPRTRPRQASGS
ncbi:MULTISPECIES: phosphatase PAP2 family protein [unclassified Streptomyces]|uniref:phosphatase PAP2 family protein n=1 Tax=unclassified Streptomyces TaxID=2593676 RepID=UPI0022B5FAF1|nr:MULTISPECIES: phosphatase PAP2 family protein [unclassified Streptomyces]MCZ7413217.1 phosphatase PAP2 family protein [Streptomyces sp. WMMC897]MCZ7430210.1 phosphatase PAP2 family protein [Streptomyces sp. WMMC1477]